MKQSEITSKLQAGELIRVVRSAKDRIGALYLSVEINYFIGEKVIPRALFDAVRSKQKLVLDIDKSTSAITVYKLSAL